MVPGMLHKIVLLQHQKAQPGLTAVIFEAGVHSRDHYKAVNILSLSLQPPCTIRSCHILKIYGHITLKCLLASVALEGVDSMTSGQECIPYRMLCDQGCPLCFCLFAGVRYWCPHLAQRSLHLPGLPSTVLQVW
jgi:hypothetical protein